MRDKYYSYGKAINIWESEAKVTSTMPEGHFAIARSRRTACPWRMSVTSVRDGRNARQLWASTRWVKGLYSVGAEAIE